MEHAQTSNQQRTHARDRRARTGAGAGRVLATALLSAAWLVSAGAAAHATEPIQLENSYVTDASEVLSASDEATANERLAQTYDETGIDLYVVFVDEFTAPSDRIDWANETADLNGLGESQYLLAVATEGRQYFISGYDSGPLSDSALDSIEQDIVPALRDSNWLGAATTAAASIEERQAAPGRNTAITVGVGAGALAVGGAAWGITRSVKRKKNEQAAQADLIELDRNAGAALVAADDAVKASAQEVEFARAQFGDDAVKKFVTALENARAQLLQAFTLRQQLDDATPDTSEQKSAWLQQIIELCETVDSTLDEQTAEFDALRNIEQNAPAALAALTARRQDAERGMPAVVSELGRLESTYSAHALSAHTGAVDQIEKLLAFAAEREQTAQQTLNGTVGSPGSSSPAIAIREGEAAVAQVEALEQSISARRQELEGIEMNCAELIAELERDIVTARSLEDATGAVTAAALATEQQVAQARIELSGTNRDPQQALQALDAANANIDSVVHAAQEVARAQQLLAANFAQAGDQVRQAESYIDARRGAVGATARTRISEARAALSRAEASLTSSPQNASAEVNRASQLASQALAAAQGDVSGWGSTGTMYSGGYTPSGGYTQSSGDSVLGAILGGILGGDGSSRGSSWGGSSRGRSSSSWGGSSRSRSSRSSGGSRRSGGGSRRSRGGGRF